jgi:hypothetical protein
MIVTAVGRDAVDAAASAQLGFGPRTQTNGAEADGEDVLS